MTSALFALLLAAPAPVAWPTVLDQAPPVPTTTWGGATYAVLAVEGFAEIPAAHCRPDAQGQCTQALPVPAAALPAHAASRATHLAVPTAEGVCQARLGPPVKLGLMGCALCAVIARKLEGCAGGAPVGFAGPVPPALRWQPRVDRSAPERAALTAWFEARLLDDLPVYALVKHSALPKQVRRVHWQVPAPKGALDVRAAGLSIPLPECRVVERRWIAATLGGASVALPDDAMTWHPLVGGLHLDGQLVAVLGRGPMDTALYGLGPKGFTPAWSAPHFRDNEECHQAPGPVDFESPCGP